MDGLEMALLFWILGKNNINADGSVNLSAYQTKTISDYQNHFTDDTVEGALNEIVQRIPTQLSQLRSDETHRTVTDAEKSAWHEMATDFYYEGEDLTVKFANEISSSTYNDDAWAWIRARIRAGNYTGIHSKDYIPFTTSNNVTLRAEIAGIDTYRKAGDTAIGRHIDFICRELWPTLKSVNPTNYNNGLIPVENVMSDGTSTTYTLTKEMNSVATVTMNGEGLTDYSYDASTYTLTFTEAPAAGTLVVTGTGTGHPWLASDLYHWLNSLSGQVASGTGLNPTVAHVDYTTSGVYDKLPTALKNVIVEKRTYIEKRYSTTGILSTSNTGDWTNIGKLWVPSEVEVYGFPVWGGKDYPAVFGIQYPLFMGNMNRIKYRSGSRSYWWLLSPYAGDTTTWCYTSYNGNASNNGASSTYVAAPVCFRVA